MPFSSFIHSFIHSFVHAFIPDMWTPCKRLGVCCWLMMARCPAELACVWVFLNLRRCRVSFVARACISSHAGLADCATLSMAPVDTRSEKCLDALYSYAHGLVASNRREGQSMETTTNPTTTIRANIDVPTVVPRTPAMLARLEELHKVSQLLLLLED